MALCSECTQSCVHMVLDIADIVRDGDVMPVENSLFLLLEIEGGLAT